MAIIKCPECGHQVSDKAPVCPSCGVEIAGYINRCTRCGEVYFRNEHFCPNCHQPASSQIETSNQKVTSQQRSTVQTHDKTQAITADETARANKRNAIDAQKGDNGDDNKNAKNKKKNYTALIVSFIIALLACGVLIYSYSNAKSNTEKDEYEFAMRSDDPTVLQQYLDNFTDAPQEHRDSIMARLDRLKMADEAWKIIARSNNKEEIIRYLNENPNSPHKTELMHRIDSIDWASASDDNTIEAYQKYIDEHATGEHYDDAQAALAKLKSKELSLEDRQMISNVFHNFFIGFNSRNESELTSSVAEVMTSFLGRENASRGDVIDYMNRSYKKDGVTSIVWRLRNDYRITKREVGDGEFEFLVRFTADQDIIRGESGSDKNSYNISARVNPDGLISEMSMSKMKRQEE